MLYLQHLVEKPLTVEMLNFELGKYGVVNKVVKFTEPISPLHVCAAWRHSQQLNA